MTDSWNDAGLLAIRVGVGGALVAHGAQKLFGWFGGYGLEGTGQWLHSLGFAAGPPKVQAAMAGLAEFGGGALLALGLGTAPAGAAVAGNMIVASSTHTGFFNMGGGYELPATFGLVGAALAISGPGRYSLDELLGHSLNRRWMAVAGLAATVGSAVYLVSTRSTPPPAAEADAMSNAEANTDSSSSQPVPDEA